MENTLEQIKNKVAVELGYSDWEQMYRVDPESCIDSINKVSEQYSKSKSNISIETDESLLKIREKHKEQMRSDIMNTIQDPDGIQYTYEQHADHKGWNKINGLEQTWARAFQYAMTILHSY